MTRRQGWMIGVAAAVLIAVLTLPLALVMPLALPDESGVTARRVEGTPWAGTLRDLNVAGLPLGDARVAFDVLPLFIGQARMGFAAPALRGIVDVASGRAGLSRANGTIDLAGRLRPLPVTRFDLEDVTASFRDGRCVSASGRIRAQIGGDIGGLQLPAGLSGTPRCDGAQLLLPLVGQSGMERIDLRVGQGGAWRADLSIRTSDPSLSAKLLSSGFASGRAGYTIRVTGAL